MLQSNQHDIQHRDLIGVPTILIILIGYIGLPLVFLTGVIPFSLRYIAYGTGGALSLFLSSKILVSTLKSEHEKLREWRPYLFATLLLLGLLLAGYSLGIGDPVPVKKNWLFYLLYVLFLSPIQEYAYRVLPVVVMRQMEITNTIARLMILTLPYIFVHTIYYNGTLLVFSAVAGYIWATLSLKTPCWLWLSISHALLGTLAMLLKMI